MGDPSGASLIGVAISIVALIGTAISNYNSRRLAKDKLDADAVALQFNAKTLRLEAEHANCLERAEELKRQAVESLARVEELKHENLERVHELRGQIADCEEKHAESLKDRAELHLKLETAIVRINNLEAKA